MGWHAGVAVAAALLLLAVDAVGERQRVGASTGSGTGSGDQPGPYDKETESQKMAEAAMRARKQNSVHHPVYTEAIKNISDAHKEKGYQTPDPVDEVSVHPRDAYLQGAPERMGIDGGRARPAGEFKELWLERENLVGVLRAIKSSDLSS